MWIQRGDVTADRICRNSLEAQFRPYVTFPTLGIMQVDFPSHPYTQARRPVDDGRRAVNIISRSRSPHHEFFDENLVREASVDSVPLTIDSNGSLVMSDTSSEHSVRRQPRMRPSHNVSPPYSLSSIVTHVPSRVQLSVIDDEGEHALVFSLG